MNLPENDLDQLHAATVTTKKIRSILEGVHFLFGSKPVEQLLPSLETACMDLYAWEATLKSKDRSGARWKVVSIRKTLEHTSEKMEHVEAIFPSIYPWDVKTRLVESIAWLKLVEPKDAEI